MCLVMLVRFGCMGGELFCSWYMTQGQAGPVMCTHQLE